VGGGGGGGAGGGGGGARGGPPRAPPPPPPLLLSSGISLWLWLSLGARGCHASTRGRFGGGTSPHGRGEGGRHGHGGGSLHACYVDGPLGVEGGTSPSWQGRAPPSGARGGGETPGRVVTDLWYRPADSSPAAPGQCRVEFNRRLGKTWWQLASLRGRALPMLPMCRER